MELRNPVIKQASLPLRVSNRSVLVGIGFVHGITGEDNESIIARCDNSRHPQHLKFVFDMSAGDQKVRELRFWTTEVLDGGNTSKFEIDEAIAAILGARDFYKRAEIQIQWDLSSAHGSRLVKFGGLVETGGRLLRATLINFLTARWNGTPRTGGRQ